MSGAPAPSAKSRCGSKGGKRRCEIVCESSSATARRERSPLPRTNKNNTITANYCLTTNLNAVSVHANAVVMAESKKQILKFKFSNVCVLNEF